jgi:hypothetical protein
VLQWELVLAQLSMEFNNSSLLTNQLYRHLPQAGDQKQLAGNGKDSLHEASVRLLAPSANSPHPLAGEHTIMKNKLVACGMPAHSTLRVLPVAV